MRRPPLAPVFLLYCAHPVAADVTQGAGTVQLAERLDRADFLERRESRQHHVAKPFAADWLGDTASPLPAPPQPVSFVRPVPHSFSAARRSSGDKGSGGGRGGAGWAVGIDSVASGETNGEPRNQIYILSRPSTASTPRRFLHDGLPSTPYARGPRSARSGNKSTGREKNTSGVTEVLKSLF